MASAQGPLKNGRDMAYRKVRAGLGGAPHARDLENEELQASAELEWDMEKELEEPGTDKFQLGDGELQAVGNSSRVADLDMETIQPSASPHGRFERLEEDPDYVTHFTRPAPKTSTRRPGSPLLRYALLGSVLFIFGLIIGRFARQPASPSSTKPPPPPDTADLLRKILADITAENIRSGVRDLAATFEEDDRLSQVKFLVRRWTELGLTDVHLTNYSVLLSQDGPSPSNITDKATGRCFLPNGKLCDPVSKDQLFSFAAYSAVGTLEAEVVDVQYGTVKDLSRANTMTNATKRVALLKLGQAPFLYTLSLLTKAGFLGVLPYVDPCDVPERPGLRHKAFGISLNQEGDPSTPGYPSIEGSFREHRPNLTSLLVQPVSASLAKELLSAPDSRGAPCVPLAAPETAERKTIALSIGTQAEYRTVHNVIGYLKGATNPDRYVLVGARHEGWRPGDMAEWSGGLAVMTQIIAALTGQSNGGWQPDRTTVFCSWGGSAFGNIGSFEWGEENGAVLQSQAVAYVGLHHPVRGRGGLRPTASPSLLQLASDIHKAQGINVTDRIGLSEEGVVIMTGIRKLSMNCSRARDCPVLNVSSAQMVGDVNFFANRLAIPTLEFTFPETRPGGKTSFLSEAFLPANASSFEILDHSFKLHETVAKATAEAILRLATDPVLPFMPLDIALDVQNKLRDDGSSWSALMSQAAALRDSATFLQSEMMRPANDPKERDPPHLRMLNDVLRDLEKTFIVPDTPSGLYRNLLYCLNAAAPQFSILKDAREAGSPDCLNASLSLVLNAVNSARGLVKSGLDLFENDPNRSN